MIETEIRRAIEEFQELDDQGKDDDKKNEKD